VALYAAVARGAGFLLARGVDDASIYLRQGAAGGELLPGMSDIDLAIVTAGPADRIRDRWGGLQRRLPWIDRLLDRPLIFEADELADVVAGGNALTYGLGRGAPAYYGERPNVDWTRTLEHPGLSGPIAGWRLLHGRDRLPAPAARDEQDERMAAWLQVVLWWRWAFLFCDQPRTPRSADVCVKLIAEPARAWLWLAHRERADGRADALRRLARRLPEEERAAALALDLMRRMPSAPEAPFADVLPALVRLTRRVDELIDEQLAGVPRDEVRVIGSTTSGSYPGVIPLAVWPAVAAPQAFAETFAVDRGSPADPAALSAAVRALGEREYHALRDGELLVLPARPIPRSRLRAVKSRTTDPVSFALLDGAQIARFPRVRGWSASDLAERAVAEHRAWLRTRRVPPRPWMPPPPASQPLALLLTAARAKLFADSLARGEPELIVAPDALARRLGPAGEAAVAAYEEGGAPPQRVLAALEPVVAELYA
jgi:hypothetical protein